MTSRRVIRGFSRLGIGGALLVTLCGAALTAVAASDRYARTKATGHLLVAGPGGVIVKFPTETDWPTIYRVMGDQFGGSSFSVQSIEPPEAPPNVEAAKTAAIGLGITAFLAFATWGLFRGVGWMLAGFARD
jgi:hypothetical protein